MGAENQVAQLTWKDVSERLTQGSAAILPIGAGAKQHGFHMPMATDQIQAEWFAQELARRYDALIWPTVTYGHYPAFIAYAGSLSLSENSFTLLVSEIVQGLLANGAKNVWILNTGISTIAGVESALSSLQRKGRLLHLRLYSGRQFRRAVADVGQQPHGSHADEIETSIMLAIAPNSVRISLAKNSPALHGRELAGPLTPADPKSPNYSASGSFGSPTLASEEKGRLLVEAILFDLRAAIDAAM